MAEQVVYDLILKPPRKSDGLTQREILVSVNGGAPTAIVVAVDVPRVGPFACPAGSIVRHEIRHRDMGGRLSEPAVLEVVMQPPLPTPAEPVEIPATPVIEYAAVVPPAGSSA